LWVLSKFGEEIRSFNLDINGRCITNNPLEEGNVASKIKLLEGKGLKG